MTRILYVDDEIINIDLFKLSFRNKYDIITALSGDEGIHILHKEKDINLVISDMRMPGMNGLEFIEKAKKIYKNIPYIILSGYAKSPQINQAIEDRLIRNYFTKPFNKTLLEKEIENCINS
jgi:two-component system response regulator (stage 0 sporulation protein F)